MSFSFAFGLILIPYALVLGLCLGYAAFAIHHLIHYGATTRLSFLVTFSYLAGTVFILFFTWQTLAGVNWSEPIEIAPSLNMSLTNIKT